MPKSKEKHREQFQHSSQHDKSLDEVKLLLETICDMKLREKTKKMMLNRVLWLAVELTGNYRCRYRSKSVVSQLGLPIQRDHVHPRRALIEELLKRNPDFDSIAKRAAMCCVVTKDEHRLLTRIDSKIDGWARYEAAKVEYIDMSESDCLDT